VTTVCWPSRYHFRATRPRTGRRVIQRATTTAAAAAPRRGSQILPNTNGLLVFYTSALRVVLAAAVHFRKANDFAWAPAATSLNCGCARVPLGSLHCRRSAMHALVDALLLRPRCTVYQLVKCLQAIAAIVIERTFFRSFLAISKKINWLTFNLILL